MINYSSYQIENNYAMCCDRTEKPNPKDVMVLDISPNHLDHLVK